jgi:hypothetical protein
VPAARRRKLEVSFNALTAQLLGEKRADPLDEYLKTRGASATSKPEEGRILAQMQRELKANCGASPPRGI